MSEPGPDDRSTVPRDARRASRRLVGRDRELELAVDSMRTEGVRLVTVTGRAGVGKSALAREVARRLMILDPVGVEEVQLSGRSGSIELEGLVAALEPPMRTDGASPLAPAPPGRTRLVLIDGAEVRQLEVAQMVTAALERDPDLAVLVTSTVRLGVPDEHLVPLAPLPLPLDGEHRPGRVAASPAVELFCERVRAVVPGFRTDEHNAADVARICVRLDGLPLGLELAAARCVAVPVAGVLELIESSSALDVASGGAVGGQEHHRSVRDAIRWSYDLLDEDAQRLLRALGIFVGHVRWEDLVAVAAGPRDDTSTLMDQLGALVAAGLVIRPIDEPDAVGHLLPSTVRDLALELLDEHGELQMVRDRHTAHFRTLARDRAPAIWSARNSEVCRSLARSWPDLLAAVQVLADGDDLRGALQMAVDLQPLWTEASATLGARLMLGLAQQLRASRPTGSDPQLDHLLAAADASVASLLVWGADVPVDAEALLLAAIEVGDSLDEPHLRLFARQTLLQTLLLVDAERALQVGTEAMAIAEVVGDDWWTAVVLSWSSVAANQAHRAELALDLAVRSQQLALRVGDRRQVLRTSFVLLGVDGAREHPDAVVPPLAELLAQARDVGDDQVEGWLAAAIALDRGLAGDLPTAAEALRDGLRLAQRLGRWSVEQLCVAALTLVVSLQGGAKDAARLHGGLMSGVGDLERMMSPSQFAAYDHMIGLDRTVLGEPAFDEMVASGRLMTWRQTLGFAEELIDQLATGDVVTAEPGHDRTPAEEIARGPRPITDRELEVLELISDGCSNKEIALRLGLRPKTVMHHSSHIYRKLGVRTRTEATTAAFQRGLLPRGGDGRAG